ncbi:hypothetical protein ABT010_24685 [Streptomyces sp. NPDC002668]|uniref:hypothetical protein n=1 Tax=Streptomyces sp. NPDC002668 TaxID=3154422 RepID=UPI00332BA75B
MDRNIWDEKTPPPDFSEPFAELRKDAMTVELCVYSLQGSKKGLEQVRTVAQDAGRIWCQAGVNVQVVHWEALPPLNIAGPLTLNSTDLARQIPCDSLSDAARSQLMAIGKPNAPAGDPTRLVPVYCIPGNNLQNAPSASGCHRHVNNPPDHMILLTDSADGRVLAHELGHALFTRSAGPSSWMNEDPDPGRNDNFPIHNTNPQNLMYPSVSVNARISPEQVTVAKESRLVTRQPLVYGFREEKRFKLGVNIKTLHVDSVSDENFSDNALESTWTFTVATSKTKESSKVFANSRLTPGEYDLSRDYDFPLLEVESEEDKLTIAVTGWDWDFWSPDDDVPSIRAEWSKDEGLWGSRLGSTSGAPTGQHKEGPVENSEIKYSVTYAIRVDDAPSEHIFREIC